MRFSVNAVRDHAALLKRDIVFNCSRSLRARTVSASVPPLFFSVFFFLNANKVQSY